MSFEACKKLAGEKAASLIEPGMIVGLGTGATATYFIQALTLRCHHGLKIQAVASSQNSHLLAEKGGIPLLNLNELTSIDVYVDGADEINPQKQMIKGAGGALLREKILAYMSREMIVVVDESKLVSELGKRPLPVEIIPFGLSATLHHLHQLGYQGQLRAHPNGALWTTENFNHLYDVRLTSSSISSDHDQIRSVPGVVETGFFPSQAGRVIVGFQDGSVVIH